MKREYGLMIFLISFFTLFNGFCESGTWNPPSPPPPEETYGSAEYMDFNIVSREDKTLNVYKFKGDFPSTYTMPDTVEIGNDKYTVVSMILDRGIFRPNWLPSYLTLPNTLKKIEKNEWDDALYNWMSPKSLNFGKSQVDTIKYRCFDMSPILESLTLSPYTKVIEDEAFCDTGLYELNFAEGLEKIGNRAFVGGGYFYVADGNDYEERYETDHCRLKEINLPRSLRVLGYGNFTGSDMVKVLILSPSLEVIRANCFSQCVKLNRLVIPNSVKKIERGAFRCRGYGEDEWPYKTKYAEMTSLTLGTNLNEIEDYTFGTLPNISDFYCLNPTPPSFQFDGLNPTAAVHVPPGSLSIYKNSPGWSEHFTNYKELPEVFIQLTNLTHFYQDYNNSYWKMDMKLGESIRLDYTTANFTGEILKSGWDVRDIFGNPTEGLKIVNDVATPYLEQIYIVRPTLIDYNGNIFSSNEYFKIDVSGQVEGYNDINEIYIRDDDFPKNPIYVFSLQGVCVGNSLENLNPGIYVVKDGVKTKKIIVK